VENSIGSSDSFIMANVLGVQNLLKLILQKPKNSNFRPKLIHISTDEVYGDTDDGEFFETDILNPSNPYSASKAAGDMLVMAWGRTHGVSYNIIRPTNNYGIRQHYEKLIPLCVRNLKRGAKIFAHNNGEPYRNWLHVDDTVRGIFTIMEIGGENEVYNIAGGCEQRNIDVIKKIIKSFDKSLDPDDIISFSEDRLGQDTRYAVNDDKLRALGWSPEALFDEELEGVVKSFAETFRW
jgi:dTDP-glucose 4,6-dehydratase